MPKKLTTEEFIVKAKSIHGEKYDYSKTIYLLSREKVIIICPIHGEFEQEPFTHLQDKGCSKCGLLDRSSTSKIFIEKAIIKNSNINNYEKTVYKNKRTKVIITCNNCKEDYFQMPDNHLKGHGCPKCKTSKGEKEIEKILNEMKIEFSKQKTFKDCINTRMLKFDFYIEEKNILIEYQGRQHYESVTGFFGGEQGFKIRQINDKIKRDYCLVNNIKLIEIKFDEEIDVKLKEQLGV